MELQSWLLYHLVAVNDCNQGGYCGPPMLDVMQSAATATYAMNNNNNNNNNNPTMPSTTTTTTAVSTTNGNNNNNNNNNNINNNNNSRAKDLGLRAQKKLLGRFAASSAGRSLLIDDATTSLLDNLYRLMDRAARSSQQLDKRQPEKVLKNIVKLSIKIGLLHRNQQLGPSDAAAMDEVRRALRATAMAVLSFYELEFSYERAYLVKSLERCRASVHALIKPHLTDKSQDRCDQVFDFLGHPDFLEAVFAANSELRPVLGALVGDVNRALETGQL